MARGAGPIPHARVRAPPPWPPRCSKRAEVSLPGAGYGAFMVAQVVLNFLLQNQVKSECLESADVLLFSFLLVSNFIALGFRVTEEGRPGLSLCATGAFLVAVTFCDGLWVFGKVQNGIGIYWVNLYIS